ncbi:tetratricopeptide repeat protein [Asticcacaulis tiandongensis]|uniref:tetratricopeptide repeat protein n=1 Tax=Asticcacaulis tiandongensis TaxID=2565365 RepID=UPI0015E87520|nr:tetratricopeptide repeat protein [Asticcacaulis tiandongensis]
MMKFFIPILAVASLLIGDMSVAQAEGDTQRGVDTSAVIDMAEAGNVCAQYVAAVLYSEDASEFADSEEELWLIKAADNGMARAQYRLGLLYLAVANTEADGEKARKYLHQAAEGREVQAQRFLAGYYDAPHIARHEEATYWWRKAAEQGLIIAQTELGLRYETGTHVTQSYEGAAKWYLEAASQGDVTAMGQLGQMYLTGTGVDKNESKGRELIAASQSEENYRKSIILSLGSTEADVDFLARYAAMKADDTEESQQSVFNEVRAEAEKGASMAKFMLGRMYISGFGTEQDIGKGVSLICESGV